MEYLSSLVLVTYKHCVLWIQSCVLICSSVHVCCRMIVHIQRDHALTHHRDLSRVRGSPAQPVTDRSLQNDHGQFTLLAALYSCPMLAHVVHLIISPEVLICVTLCWQVHEPVFWPLLGSEEALVLIDFLRNISVWTVVMYCYHKFLCTTFLCGW